MFRTFIKDYLTFNRKDRIGLIALILLMFLALILPKLYKTSFKGKTASFVTKPIYIENSSSKAHSATEEVQEYPFEDNYGPGRIASGQELFDFDPNTVSAYDLERLGLQKRIIKTLINYRNKGGRFNESEDLTKIWGLPPAFYARVKDHIKIVAPKTSFTKAEVVKEIPKSKPIASVEINSADQQAFIALPGIGEKLSARIINFRDKLGGFNSIDQVAETYALPDSTFQKIKPMLKVAPELVRRISLNLSSKEELKEHPYIRWKLANAIVEYRNQHGNFNKLEDLKAITIIDEATFNKIAPYLSL